MQLISEPFLNIYRQKYLLKEFIGREVHGRFAGSFAGALWAVLTPLATIAAYYFVFSLVLRIPVSAEENGTDHFAVFFLSGFFPWVMFAEGLSRSIGSIVGNAQLVTKVVFSVEILPVSAVTANFFLQGTGYALFLLYIGMTGCFSIQWIFLPLVMAALFFFTLGIAFFLSAISVFIRDTGEIFGIVIMLWFFATPIIYPVSMLPEGFDFILLINPMVDFILVIKGILLFGRFYCIDLLKLILYAVVSYSIGSYFFMRLKHAFADVL